MSKATYIALWPNHTASVVCAHSKAELFDVLDEEGSPFAADVRKIPRAWSSVQFGARAQTGLVIEGVEVRVGDSKAWGELEKVTFTEDDLKKQLGY
jgi:hypothetical protein